MHEFMPAENHSEFATIDHLTSLFAKRKLSPVEVVTEFLRRIERLNPQLNAYLTVTAELALRAASRAEKEWSHRKSASSSDKPLLGIPVALKDNIWTRGVRTTIGSRILRDYVPTEDATVVRKLARAGAILLGKTNLHEFAYGVTNNNPHFGPVRNPWALDRISGGSSGGSAVAIAAGMCTAALGTDTGGSLRIPGALCGVVGLKPTFGRVSVYGVAPLSPSLDHVGPLTRSVSDAATMLGVLCGRDPRDATSVGGKEDFSRALRKPLPKFRLGRPREYFWDELDDEVRSVADAAILDMVQGGVKLREVSLPGVRDSLRSATKIALAEARYGHERAGYFPAHAGEYGEDIRTWMEAGSDIRAIDYLAAFAIQKTIRAEFEAAFENVDVIVTPTLPVIAPLIGATHVTIGEQNMDVRTALLAFNRPANFTGYPAISIPCGFTREGLPVGLQLIGRPFDESTLLRIALFYERGHTWRDTHPPLD
jgi:aspartyl-tRNA(Asn)/glutamyl-tRNA(Gln) amidotransferase subunit A